MIRGQFFGEMIRVSVRKSELQRKSRSYSSKVRVTTGKFESNCPNQVSESDVGNSTEKGLNKEGKSAINLSNLGIFCQIWPRAVYLC